jgi:hypothetical protein
VTYSEVEGIGHVAGTLDGRHHLVLPADEYPRDARDGRVLSVRYGPVAASGFARSSTVIVRDVVTGDVLVHAEVPGDLGGAGSAVLGADVAYFAAHAPEPAGLVPAIQAISLADGTIREVLPAQDRGVDPDGLPPFNAASGGPLALSPSGRTLGFCIFQNHLCDIQVVDLATGSSWVPVRGLAGGLWLLSDEVLVGFRSHVPIIGYDIATGETAWSIEALGLSGYLLSDGLTLVLAYQEVVGSSDGVIAAVDLRTGERRDLLRTPPTEVHPYLWAEASNDRYAVLIPGGLRFPYAFARTGSFSADLLDISSGNIERSALRVSIRGRE